MQPSLSTKRLKSGLSIRIKKVRAHIGFKISTKKPDSGDDQGTDGSLALRIESLGPEEHSTGGICLFLILELYSAYF